MKKKQRKKLQGGEAIVFRLPAEPNKKVLDFLNETRVSRSKKINEALEYYVENKEIISEIKSDLKKILEEISSVPKDVQTKKSSKSMDAEARLLLNIKNAIDKIDKMK
ncbi:hypothetical protein [Caldanaerobacter subterraneus]|uniref:Uncharacterized protein n=1 Tax=Caldanaerobacter subterraneus TaxID=911092 RepID=A0A7Y2L984_9THEO|nr:hypothetical protein [Caldanaerobacter subterraneus]NNG67537.1 hypothetical protein [Caldanaerobacter subterraneus]